MFASTRFISIGTVSITGRSPDWRPKLSQTHQIQSHTEAPSAARPVSRQV